MVRYTQTTDTYETERQFGFEPPARESGVLLETVPVTADMAGADPHGKGQVISFVPRTGTLHFGRSRLRFAMEPERVHQVLGLPERVTDDSDSHRSLCERYYNRGVTLRYSGLESAYPCCGGMFLCEVGIAERFGWQVRVGGIPLFEDKRLEGMKARHKYLESRRRGIVAFPTEGIFTVGCGEKEGAGPYDGGKMVLLCSRQVIRFYISMIGSWDCWS